MAAGEEDPCRQRELLRIAETCAGVPEAPARSFWEAVQSFWFTHLIIQIESNGHSISPGRLDQYLYPFYERDIREGTLTHADALELLQCLWIKVNELNKVRDRISSRAFGGYPLFQNLIIGGQNPEGQEATNALSYLCLETTAATRLPQPSLSVRIHKDNPEEWLLATCEVAKLGTGMPAFFNDEAITPMLCTMGCSLAEARDYAEVGCVEPQCPGTTQGFYTGGFLSLAKCLELALHGGHGSYGEVTAAFEAQVAHAVELLVAGDHAIEEAHARLAPSPFLSLLVDDGLARGQAVESSGARLNFASPNAVGLANVADALG